VGGYQKPLAPKTMNFDTTMGERTATVKGGIRKICVAEGTVRRTAE